MTSRQRFALLLLLAVPIALPALAAPATFAAKVEAIETAQAAELARLNDLIARSGDLGEILALQRCATHVKLVSRLALHEAQLAVATDGAQRDTLAGLIATLSARIEAGAKLLPAGYAFAPLAAAAEEVPPCAK